MFRLTQIIRNLFLRLEGFFSVIFRSLFNFLGSFFSFFGKLFGFSNSSGYFLESNQTQSTKQQTTQQTTQQSIETEPSRASETSTAYRRPNPEMDYYRKMAQEVKKR
ncbi:MAG: threonine dehydratase [Iphinoe sp. HA4291-MV1]|nr:threonine dehydratase [Iphinoe sp. HA4291-MV1]